VRREAHPAATQFRVTSHYVRLAAAVLNSAKTLPHRFRCYPRMCPPSLAACNLQFNYHSDRADL
jgi:hypothetical protein